MLAVVINPIPLGFLRVRGFGWEGEEGLVPASYNSKYINDIEIKFDGVVENHELINLE